MAAHCKSLASDETTVFATRTGASQAQEILHREKGFLPYTHEEIERILDGLCQRAEQWRLHSHWWPVLTDPDDEAMVHLAVYSKVAYVVNHNVRHLQPAGALGVRVVMPREFLSKLSV